MDTNGKKATLLTSDWQYGDVYQLIRSWRACHIQALEEVIAPFRPDQIVFIENGDMATGKGIFRNQSDQLLFQQPENQALWAAWELAHIHRQAATIAPAEHRLIWGNHDDAGLVDLARRLGEYLTLMGVPSQYYPQEYVGNFGMLKRPGAWFHAAHGFGHSDYYAQTYSAIRDMWRLQSEIMQTKDIRVSRFMRAHTHFMQAGLWIALNTWCDTAGGWQAQRRWNISKAVRNTGVIVYLDDGQRTEIIEVHAETDLLLRESKDPHLEEHNRAEASRCILEAKRFIDESRGSVMVEAERSLGDWLAKRLGRS